MKRSERILKHLQDYVINLDSQNISEETGLHSQQLAEQLGLLRNNVSQELNHLCRQGVVIKLKTHPVRFLPKDFAEKYFVYTKQNDEWTFVRSDAAADSEDPFIRLIGHASSLREQVVQAKAAILYPPHGLHTLITGQTGVGKSLFASLMFEYARSSAILNKNAPFVVFNCADYYNNPQLLMGHLFGYTKGAYTGAENDKDGIIARANGGILFLDEVHRLPPEGQEMIFYFMDTGRYNRLGETDNLRKSSLLLICATTENPQSALLKTFVRRIPIVIHLPTVQERSPEEKISLVRFLFKQEAARIQKPINIDAESVKALVGNTSFGNVGQLKSNIQLLCANGFLNALNQRELRIVFDDLPLNIKKGLYELGRRHGQLQQLADLLGNGITITPGEIPCSGIPEDAWQPSFNLYQIIENKVAFLEEQGISSDEINRYVSIDIEIHLNNLFKKFAHKESPRENLLKLVNADVLEFSEQIQSLAESMLNQSLNDRFLLAFTLHISAFLERHERGEILYAGKRTEEILENRREIALANEISLRVEKRFNVRMSGREIYYLTLLIHSLHHDARGERVAVLVVMHGDSTASSMVRVAQELLDETNISSIDMPLDMRPDFALTVVKEKITAINRGRGVLMLVDMGSLLNFGEAISRETGIAVRTLPMVTTAMVIEAARKSGILGISLDEVHTALRIFKGYGSYPQVSMQPEARAADGRQKAILVVCSSGHGTAEKLTSLVEDMLLASDRGEIYVMPLSLSQARLDRQSLKSKWEFVMAMGIADPQFDVPFLPLESLFSHDGEKRFHQLLAGEQLPAPEGCRHPSMVRKVTLESLQEFVTFLNPHKIIDLILNFIEAVEQLEARQLSNAVKVNLSLHLGNALERAVQGCPLTFTIQPDTSQPRYQQYRQLTEMFEKRLGIKLPEGEIAYLMEIVDEFSQHAD